MRRLAPLVPYVAVGLGLYVFHSAWAALIGYHVLMAVFLTLAGAGKEQIRLFWPPGHKRWIIFTSLLCAASGIGLYFLWPIFGVTPNLGRLLPAIGLDLASWPFFILYFCLVNPWLEETFWRGWLGSPNTFPVAADIWFAGFHLLVVAAYIPWPWLVFVLVTLSAVGWFWRQITRLEGSLFAPWLSHLLADATILLAIYLHI